MKIMSLIDKDIFIEAIVYNYTNERVDEIVFTHNVFKAKNIKRLNNETLIEIANYVRKSM